jgi:hypothetical protein
MVAIVFKLIGLFSYESGSSPHRDEEAAKIAAQTHEAIRDTAKASAVKDKLTGIAGVALDALQSGRPLALISFTPADPSLSEVTRIAFATLQQQAVANGHQDRVAVSLTPLAADASDVVALARATSLQSQWLVTGISRGQTADQFSLEVKLYETQTGKIVWQDTRTARRINVEADALGKSIATEILSRVKLDR